MGPKKHLGRTLLIGFISSTGKQTLMEHIGNIDLALALRGYPDRTPPEAPTASSAIAVASRPVIDSAAGAGMAAAKTIEKSRRRTAMTWTLDTPDLLRVVERMARAQCPSWFREELRQEVQQETLLRLAQKGDAADGHPRQFFSSFLWQTIHYVRGEVARREGRRHDREVPLPDSESGPVDPSQWSGSPDQVARRHETGQIIRICLQQLSKDRRVAVTLHLTGYTYQEIAQQLEWSRKSAENRVCRGLRQLRAKLVDRGVEL